MTFGQVTSMVIINEKRLTLTIRSVSLKSHGHLLFPVEEVFQMSASIRAYMNISTPDRERAVNM